MKELIRKQDCELTEADLMCIFQGALPAGVYHEVMYFLPIALQHIVENQENDTLDLEMPIGKFSAPTFAFSL